MAPHGTRSDSPIEFQSTLAEQCEPLHGWMNDQGFFADMKTCEPTELEVTGTIPKYTAGTLYRTGPAAFKMKTANGDDFAMSHWFDGFNKVHRFQIVPDSSPNGVRVTYNARKTCDEHLEQIRTDSSLKGFSFAQKRDPCESYFKKAQSTFSAMVGVRNGDSDVGPSAANINVTVTVNFPGNPGGTGNEKREGNGGIKTLHTKTDASSLQALDPETLEPIGIARQQSLHPELKGQMSAAHAKSDPLTGDMFNFNLEAGPNPTYRVWHASASTGKTDILATFPATAAYIHSLFLTAEHVILCVWNSHLTMGGASVLWNKNVLDSIGTFNASQPAMWYVVDRHGKGLLATYESPAFYCFHTINAWTETSTSGEISILCDLSAYDNVDCLKVFYYENLISTSPASRKLAGEARKGCLPMFRRYRLPNVPTTPDATIRKAHIVINAPKESSMELPTMNGSYISKPHRYTYGTADRGKSSFVDGLVKFDSQTLQPHFWEQHAQSPGEPIFVADPEGSVEDDGVLLSVVLDGNTGKSYMLCLSAKDMTELGRASVNGVVGFGFHGTHVKTSGETIDV